ncbi:MAG: hypothetical protein K5793_04175 [Nitrosarchaeum sp.]|nr:hypothetical protein [Nitrosarchaeum sp.]
MELFTLAIASFILGIVTGILSRIDRLKLLAVIIGSGSLFTLLIILGNTLTYIQNPTIDGLYVFIVSIIPFVISLAFSAKGEEIVQNFARN